MKTSCLRAAAMNSRPIACSSGEVAMPDWRLPKGESCSALPTPQNKAKERLKHAIEAFRVRCLATVIISTP